MSGILFLRSKLDFKSTILWQQNVVTLLESNRDQLAIPITLARANSHHLARVQLESQEHSQVMK
jgi:GAF domain-containing protein